MAKEKKRIGRAPGPTRPYPLQVSISQELLDRLDDWRRSQPDLPPRTEAVRRMIELATKALKKGPPK
jgi:hypothetical protein